MKELEDMMFPKEREIGSSSGLGQGEVDVKNLSFFKIFQGDDLSSESMVLFFTKSLHLLKFEVFSC